MPSKKYKHTNNSIPHVIRLSIIPLILAGIVFLFLAYPYVLSKITPFSSLGFYSVIDENAITTQRTFNKTLRKNVMDEKILLKNEKIIGKFTAQENNLGIILVRFIRYGNSADAVVFRLKEKGRKDWYYQNKYLVNQFQPNQYFTFGFPNISNSENKEYIFEIESLYGNNRDAVGVNVHAPHAAVVYKYSRDVLSDYPELISILYRKLIYAAHHVNYGLIASTFFWSFLIVSFFSFNRSLKIKLTKIVQKNKRHKSKLLKGTKSIKRTLALISDSSIYKMLFGTSIKKRIVISTLLFTIAFLYRLTPAIGPEHTGLYYSALGGQGDYDEMIRVGRCAIVDYKNCEGIIIYDFYLLTPLLGLMFLFFGFIGGINAFLYIMLILSSVVAILPYVLFSRKNWLTMGGIIGSFILATNDFLVKMAIGFPIDNSAIFLFSIFAITYYLTLQKATLSWLIFFGFIGFADGLNKVLFFINNLLVFIFFIPIFFYERVKKLTNPFASKPNRKILLMGILPLIVFIVLYVGWEIYVAYDFNAKHYFLKQLILERGGGYTYYVTNDSPMVKNIFLLPLYVLVSGVIMIKRLLDYIDLPTLFYGIVFLGTYIAVFLNSKFSSRESIISIIFSVLLTILLMIIHDNVYKIHELFAGDNIIGWDFDMYLRMFLFIEIIFLFIIRMKYKAIKLLIPIIVYVGMLTLMARNAPLPRLHTHVVVASITLLAYIIDWVLIRISTSATPRSIRLGPIMLLLFVCFYIIPLTLACSMNFYKAVISHNDEIKYLKWANESLPSNAIILGGGNDDLILTAQNVYRPIIYNSLYGAAQLIPSSHDYRAIKIIDIVSYLQKKQNFDKNKYIILEENKEVWRDRLTKDNDGIFTKTKNYPHPENYSIKLYKYNDNLKKGIYELRLKEKPSSTTN